MEASFSAKVLFLSCAIISSSYASQRELTNYRANIYLRNVQAMDKETKSAHNAIKFLPRSDIARIQVINRGGMRDLEVHGKQIILMIFGHSRVDLIPWVDSLSHQQRECFISAFEHIRQL